MKHPKLLVTAVVVALVLAAFATYKSLSHGDVQLTAAATPGTNYIENYSPAVLYNGGISSQLPIQTTSDITAATFSATSLTVGSATGGTAVSKFVAPSNCTIIANANTIAASSTKDVDCAVTGARAGDNFIVVATTSPSTTFFGLQILASRASTTNDFVTLTLANETGTTFTWTGTASTSFKAFGVR